MRIVFWQNILSPIQSAAIRALAELHVGEVIWVAQEDISPARQKMGWSVPNTGQVRTLVAPTQSEIDYLIHERAADTTHIFSMIHMEPIGRVFKQCLCTDAAIGLISEPYDWRGLKGGLRYARGIWHRFQWDRRLLFILAIGHLGVKWYANCRYPPQKIYPYAYCVEPYANSERTYAKAAPFRLLYIGACIPRKGIDLLITALAALTNYDWQLDIVGDGPQRESLERLALSLGISGRVTFLGMKSNTASRALLESQDLLVLPSRWDGWGAVVNEALSCGVPVVCSDHCGAADLIVNPLVGSVFESGNVEALSHTLQQHFEAGKLTSEASTSIRQQAAYVSGPVLARYMLDVIAAAHGEADCPAAPWRIDHTS